MATARQTHAQSLPVCEFHKVYIPQNTTIAFVKAQSLNISLKTKIVFMSVGIIN